MRLKPDLKNLYIGALESLGSNNVDKIRHFTTSLRELFTHVLHLLAPDAGIQSWTQDATHYDRGKPTRAARLLYISRKLNSKKFDKYLQHDVKATVEFIDVINSGTHGISSSFTETQLRIMKSRMESTLVYMIETSKID